MKVRLPPGENAGPLASASLWSPRGRILIIDDDEMTRALVHATLVREGHEVEEAADGTEGLRKLAAQTFDVVILDFVMPGISGQQVLEGVRGRWSPIELPVIMATARDASEDIIRALNTGANDYIVKPLDAEVLLARIRTQLRVKRLADLRTQFVELASHDLRGLLTILRGGAAALKFAVPPGRAMTQTSFELLCNVHDNAVQLQQMLEDFLDVKALREELTVKGHVDARSFDVESSEAFSINDVARHLVALYGPYASQKGVQVRAEMAANDPLALGNPRLVRQVLQNLIDNAVKFGPPDSTVVVRTSQNLSGLRVEVSDNGPGIPAHDLPDLFIKGKPLTNRPTGGEQSTHVGLPLCKFYLQLHGSDLEVHNREEGGVCFSFVLPRG